MIDFITNVDDIIFHEEIALVTNLICNYANSLHLHSNNNKNKNSKTHEVMQTAKEKNSMLVLL